MAQVIDSDVVFDGKVGHNSYHTNIADMEGLICQALAQIAGVTSQNNTVNITAIQNFVSSQALVVGLQPSGDITGATDTPAIQGLLNLGATVMLGTGKFYLNAPLTIPPYTALVGQPNTSQVTQTDAGSTLVVTAGFTGKTITDGGSVTLKAAILLLGQTFGGYSTVSEEAHIRDIQIDGSSAPANVHGIQSYGRVTRVQMERVLISKVPGDGLHHTVDGSGNQPDGWTLFKVFVRFNGGDGFSLRSADSTYIACLTSNTGTIGWFINTESNSKYFACRSEHAGTLGWGYVCANSGNSSGGTIFVGCSTDQSAQHGFQVGGTINGITSFAHAVPLLLSGCMFRRDGQNSGSGGNYAGLYVHGYGATSGGLVTVSGCQVWPGVNDDGTGALTPKYGIWVDNASNVAIGGGTSSCAATGGTAIFDDSSGGANSILYDNSVSTGVGATGTMNINTSPNIAAYQGVSMTLTPGSAPSNDPLQIVNANNGERSFGIRVAGQNNDKVKITSDAAIALGPGNATQDTNLYRKNVGILASDSVLFLGNNSAPSTPSGGGILYVTGGALHYKGSSGTDTTLAPA